MMEMLYLPYILGWNITEKEQAILKRGVYQRSKKKNKNNNKDSNNRTTSKTTTIILIIVVVEVIFIDA